MVCDKAGEVLGEGDDAVLILILLEYGLRLVMKPEKEKELESLNPYSTGIWSATKNEQTDKESNQSLNPYSTGIWSATYTKVHYRTVTLPS